MGDAVAMSGNGMTASGAWPAANLAIYIPFVLSRPTVVRRIGWFNGATASGNVDAGIYDYAKARVVSTGSTAQAGVSAVQSVDIADTALAPGQYWMGLALSSATGTVFRTAGTNMLWWAFGLQQQASALPLPATATFAIPANAFLPLMFLLLNGTV